jgi:hypothetical protein
METRQLKALVHTFVVDTEDLALREHRALPIPENTTRVCLLIKAIHEWFIINCDPELTVFLRFLKKYYYILHLKVHVILTGCWILQKR